MRISVFGLGYVGSVSAACLADWGHSVIGVDAHTLKVEMINAGRSPIIETGIADLIERTTGNGSLSATPNTEDAILKSDISFVCVGTPSKPNGGLDYSYLANVSRDIGHAMVKKNSFHTVAIRSTALPGTMHEVVIPILEQTTGWKAGKDFGICTNPEFLREGSAIHDFKTPSRTVIGANDERSGDMVQEIYSPLPGMVIRCPINIAEMIKYADNAWHATKVAFANEIGRFCKAEGIDSHQVMDIFAQDGKLNISPAYLKPGFAFGGSCLPKDLRALTAKARELNVDLPMLSTLMPSNRSQIEQGLEMVLASGKKKIGILGFSFKAGTDDLRCSPMVDVIEALIGKGCDLRLYDRNVNLAKLMGANRDYIMKVVPHIERLMCERIDDVLAHADIIVIGNNDPEFAQIAEWVRPEQHVIDFVRVKSIEQKHANYDGICW
ncbi:MAG TPA: UDP-glucose/GDP-mannose dehydrogenase family protein [Alphaproteobacteria bacterium]|nr:UDP-glucose/GDP-mannose dehydrogenase family protein [Alphaproteobacteria bacterium]